MVFAHAYIITRMEFGSTLAHNNVTRYHSLAAEFFNAKTATS
jgi:hypothetical protein